MKINGNFARFFFLPQKEILRTLAFYPLKFSGLLKKLCKENNLHICEHKARAFKVSFIHWQQNVYSNFLLRFACTNFLPIFSQFTNNLPKKIYGGTCNNFHRSLQIIFIESMKYAFCCI